MDTFEQPISSAIWDIKYRYRHRGKIIDETLCDTFRRVANAAAKAEEKSQRKTWGKKFYDTLEGFHFLPGGRILAGAGTKHKVTLFNCFVMPVLDDSLSGIFDSIKEGALTLQQGGGVGYDFSTLRPRGFLIKQTELPASGPVSFMRIWDAMCATMLSTGARRGAMMGILRCDHPDIEEFIAAKSDPQALRHFNVSVLVSDAFMSAVKTDREWELVFSPLSGERRVVRTVSARSLWQKIIKSAYDYAEPGVIFEDTINRTNNLWYAEKISATNPCGEIPLPIYGACNLGALNLTQFVTNPFTETASLDWKKLEDIASTATRFLDNIISVSGYPLKKQKEAAFATRRIGLGITGLADVFVMLGLRYGGAESLKLAARLMRCLSETTWNTSIDLAQERGSFPLFQKENYLRSDFVERLPIEIQKAIEKNGIRNSHHNTIAPTGTISLLANNVSNGIEPIFSAHYERVVRLPDGEAKTFFVMDYALKAWQKKQSNSKLPPAWVDTQSLLPEDHIAIQAAVQPYIDNAISKTINIPENFPFEKLSDIYTQAYTAGLKGCTIFRPNPVTGSVLTVASPDDSADRCCQIS